MSAKTLVFAYHDIGCAGIEALLAAGYQIDAVFTHADDARENRFFGSVAQGLASVVEKAVSQFGLPNGYILGEEGSGAFMLGARYGQGTLYTRNAGDLAVYWQGPSVGLDFGGDGSKVMMLVYNLPDVRAIYQRYPGVAGSAYVVGGLGMTVLKTGNVVVVPIRSGIGARIGVNAGYLHFTRDATWNPF